MHALVVDRLRAFLKGQALPKKYWVLALLFMIGLCHAIWYRAYQPDDAFIYLVYVKNLLTGHGPTFNGTVVEGYSSVLWLYAISLLSSLGADPLMSAKVMGWFFYIATAVVLLKMQAAASRDNEWLPYAVMLFFSIPIMALWASGGMESMLFVFLMTAVAYIYYHARLVSKKSLHFIIAGILFGLLAAARPEGFALIAAIFGLEFFIVVIRRDIAVRSMAITFITYVAILGLLVGIRYAMYGEFFPATVYAKTGNTMRQYVLGKAYVLDFMRDYRYFGLAYVVATFFLLLKRDQTSWLLLTSFIFISGYTLFNLFVGGDWMIAHRFMIPVVPLMAASIGIALTYVKPRYALVLMALFVAYTFSMDIRLHHQALEEVSGSHGAVLLGQYLKAKNLPTSAHVAVVDAGAIPYYSEMKTIDMIGLNDVHIAKLPGGFFQKYDNDYVLALKPEYIQFHTHLITRDGSYVPDDSFDGTLLMFYSEIFQKWYERDVNAPIPFLYKRRSEPLETTFLNGFYDFKLNGAYNPDTKQLTLSLKKDGDGVWPTRYDGRDNAGTVFVQIKATKANGKVLFENMVPIPTDMKMGDQDVISTDLSSVKDNSYRLWACPIMFGVKMFPGCTEGSQYEYNSLKDVPVLTRGFAAFNDERLVLEGWADPEKSFVWSLGNHAKLAFNIDEKSLPLSPKVYLITYGKRPQNIQIYMNKSEVFKGSVFGPTAIDLKQTVQGGHNEIQFVLPDAASPGMGDTRILSIGLQSIELK